MRPMVQTFANLRRDRWMFVGDETRNFHELLEAKFLENMKFLAPTFAEGALTLLQAYIHKGPALGLNFHRTEYLRLALWGFV